MNKIIYLISFVTVISVEALAQQINHVYSATEMSEGQGADVLRLFPTTSLKHADPFILMDDFSVAPPAGFPAHMHKGFEAITYMLEGGFVHKDNLGNTDTIFKGEAQRFTAGKGLVHSEMPGTILINRGLQLWLNIPFSNKENAPSYQLVESLPVDVIDGTIIVRTIVGTNSPLQVNCGCDLEYKDIQLKNASIKFSPKANYISFVYVIHGVIGINNVSIASGNYYFISPDLTTEVLSNGDAQFVYLSAMPLNQQIKQRGPYVY